MIRNFLPNECACAGVIGYSLFGCEIELHHIT